MKKDLSLEKPEKTLKEIILSVKEWSVYIFQNWKSVLIFVVIGIGLGIFKYFTSKPKFVAESYFVLDEGGSKRVGGIKLEMLGLGSDAENGLFQTDNIIWLYSSRLMLERTLLSEVDTNGKKVILINWFMKESGVDKEIKKDKKMWDVLFSSKSLTDSLTRDQNKVIAKCISLINEKYLKVNQTKKTDNIINVAFTAGDELMAKVFTEKVVDIVNNYYVQTKIGKTSREVAILQAKADSVKGELNRSMYQTASALDATPNLNPALQILKVKPQQRGVDVQVTSSIYTEVVKMLETRKMELAKETPLIQVIDAPVLPLRYIKSGIIKNCIIGGVGAGVLTIGLLTIILFYKRVMN